jgi:uncharacterized protein (DUF1330 family)
MPAELAMHGSLRRWGRTRLAAAALLLGATPAHGDPVADYVSLATGTFTSAAQARQDARYGVAEWHVAEIWRDDATPERWLYVESWMKDASAPYLQRIVRASAQPDGAVLTVRYEIPDAAKYVGAWREPSRFATLSPDALTAVPGCDVVLVRTGERRWEGGTHGARCRNGYKGASYAVSQTVLTADGMTNWDRGFDAAGALRWGPEYGGYRLQRADAPASCDSPVRLLVYGEIADRKGFGAYVRALADSKLYAKYGGWYEAVSPAVATLEGTPPPGRGVIIARFPCLEAVQSFWNSPEYAEIRKLREGIAKFEVLVLPAAQMAPWSTAR